MQCNSNISKDGATFPRLEGRWGHSPYVSQMMGTDDPQVLVREVSKITQHME